MNRQSVEQLKFDLKSCHESYSRFLGKSLLITKKLREIIQENPHFKGIFIAEETIVEHRIGFSLLGHKFFIRIENAFELNRFDEGFIKTFLIQNPNSKEEKNIQILSYSFGHLENVRGTYEGYLINSFGIPYLLEVFNGYFRYLLESKKENEHFGFPI